MTNLPLALFVAFYSVHALYTAQSRQTDDAIHHITYGDADNLEKIIARGFNVNKPMQVAEDGFFVQQTPLNFALKKCLLNQKHAIVNILLKNGADPNHSIIHNQTPLVSAIKSHEQHIVELLLEHNAQVTFFALVEALANPLILQTLLKKDASLINKPCYQDSETTLLMATLTKEDWPPEKKLETITVLLEFNAEVTAQALATAFKLDLQRPSPTLLMTLLMKDATLINEPIIEHDGQLKTLLDTAVEQHQTSIAQALLQNEKTSTEQKKKHLISIVSNQSSPKDWIPYLKDSPEILTQALISHASSRSINPQTIKDLITKGANINAQDQDGNSILILIIKSFIKSAEKKDLIEVMLKAGANVNIKNNNDDTALIYATQYLAKETRKNIVETIIEAGADINARNKDGETALLRAIKYSFGEAKEDSDLIISLIKKGADINVLDRNGATISTLLAHDNHHAVIKYLKANSVLNLPTKKQTAHIKSVTVVQQTEQKQKKDIRTILPTIRLAAIIIPALISLLQSIRSKERFRLARVALMHLFSKNKKEWTTEELHIIKELQVTYGISAALFTAGLLAPTVF
jgi:ankyrin repeat protein